MKNIDSSLMCIITIYRKKLKFLCFESVVLQDKFDLLFTTVRLMGYEIIDQDGVINVASISNKYVVLMRSVRDNKGVLMNFDLLGDIATNTYIKMEERINFLYSSEVDKLLEELDGILAYI